MANEDDLADGPTRPTPEGPRENTNDPPQAIYLETHVTHVPESRDLWLRVAPTSAPPAGRADREPFAAAVRVPGLPAGPRLATQKAR